MFLSVNKSSENILCSKSHICKPYLFSQTLTLVLLCFACFFWEYKYKKEILLSRGLNFGFCPSTVDKYKSQHQKDNQPVAGWNFFFLKCICFNRANRLEIKWQKEKHFWQRRTATGWFSSVLWMREVSQDSPLFSLWPEVKPSPRADLCPPHFWKGGWRKCEKSMHNLMNTSPLVTLSFNMSFHINDRMPASVETTYIMSDVSGRCCY